MTNSTLVSPIYRGENLYCTPTNWYDIWVFFLGNYIAHALTIKAYPGEATTSVLIAALGALLIPVTGLTRGINAIARNAKFKRKRFLSALSGDPDYQTAVAAGALCMVVRKKSWKPYPGEELSNVMLRDEAQAKSYGKWTQRLRALKKWSGAPIWLEVEPIARSADAPEPVRTLKVYRGPWTEERGRYWLYTDTYEQYVHPSKTIQGLCDFKDQAWSYALAHVPHDALLTVNRVEGITPRRLESTGTGISNKSSITAVGCAESLPGSQTAGNPIIAASFSIPKSVIAIVQLGYASMTLYQSKGVPIEQYGYAAFALTVIPYALMSLINLTGNLLTPDYQALYLVGSDVMDEAIQRGCRFDGVVGRLVQDMNDKSAKIEVLLSGKDEKMSEAKFSYSDITKKKKTISVSVVDYSSPPLPKPARRKYMKEKLEAMSKDLSASLFIPSCAEFRRLNSHTYPTNTNRSQMTPQGAVGFSDQRLSDEKLGICFVFIALILGIIGGVTGFRAGHASASQLNWVMQWYVYGAFSNGIFFAWNGIQRRPWPEPDMGQPSKHVIWLMMVPLVFNGIPAMGGFVSVIDMLLEFGTCTSY